MDIIKTEGTNVTSLDIPESATISAKEGDIAPRWRSASRPEGTRYPDAPQATLQPIELPNRDTFE